MKNPTPIKIIIHLDRTGKTLEELIENIVEIQEKNLSTNIEVTVEV